MFRRLFDRSPDGRRSAEEPRRTAGKLVPALRDVCPAGDAAQTPGISEAELLAPLNDRLTLPPPTDGARVETSRARGPERQEASKPQPSVARGPGRGTDSDASAAVPLPPRGMPADFGEVFREAFRRNFRKDFLSAFGPPCLGDVRRAADIRHRGVAGRGVPGTEAFRMACRLAFMGAWDAAYAPAYRDAAYRTLFQARPPALKRGFRREFRAEFRSRFAPTFWGEFRAVMERAYGELLDRDLKALFLKRFLHAFRWSYGAAFVKAFREAYP